MTSYPKTVSIVPDEIPRLSLRGGQKQKEEAATTSTQNDNNEPSPRNPQQQQQQQQQQQKKEDNSDTIQSYRNEQKQQQQQQQQQSRSESTSRHTIAKKTTAAFVERHIEYVPVRHTPEQARQHPESRFVMSRLVVLDNRGGALRSASRNSSSNSARQQQQHLHETNKRNSSKKSPSSASSNAAAAPAYESKPVWNFNTHAGTSSHNVTLGVSPVRQRQESRAGSTPRRRGDSPSKSASSGDGSSAPAPSPSPRRANTTNGTTATVEQDQQQGVNGNGNDNVPMLKMGALQRGNSKTMLQQQQASLPSSSRRRAESPVASRHGSTSHGFDDSRVGSRYGEAVFSRFERSQSAPRTRPSTTDESPPAHGNNKHEETNNGGQQQQHVFGHTESGRERSLRAKHEDLIDAYERHFFDKPFTPRVNPAPQDSSRTRPPPSEIYDTLFYDAQERDKRMLFQANPSSFYEVNKMWEGFRDEPRDADVLDNYSAHGAVSRAQHQHGWNASFKASTNYIPKPATVSRSQWIERGKSFASMSNMKRNSVSNLKQLGN